MKKAASLLLLLALFMLTLGARDWRDADFWVRGVDEENGLLRLEPVQPVIVYVSIVDGSPVPGKLKIRCSSQVLEKFITSVSGRTLPVYENRLRCDGTLYIVRFLEYQPRGER